MDEEQPLEVNRRGVAITIVLLVAFAALLSRVVSPKQATLFVLGAALGVVLYHAAFGFTSAWRAFILEGRGAGLRAQMVMLGLATLLFFPTLAHGTAFGTTVRPDLAPVGVSVMVGAFIFGIGMQLGGACGSGTLYTVGGGNTRMIVTLSMFIVGSVIGAAQLPWWEKKGSLGAISVLTKLGLARALSLQLAVFALVAWITIVVEKRKHGRLIPQEPPLRTGMARVLRGPWPLVAGAIGLAVLNFATLLLAGRPWGVTSAFALWGSKVLRAFGVGVDTWSYWSTPPRALALRSSLLADITSVMDFGLVLGALLAAMLAGKFAPKWKVPPRSLAAAILGGLMLGYGARLSYGCNVGSFFSGIASASVHGWLWLVAAFIGNAIGVRLRPTFQLQAN